MSFSTTSVGNQELPAVVKQKNPTLKLAASKKKNGIVLEPVSLVLPSSSVPG